MRTLPLGGHTRTSAKLAMRIFAVQAHEWSPNLMVSLLLFKALEHAGSALAVLPVASDVLFVWDAANKSAEKVSLGVHLQQQELTAACWANDNVQLAVGASKGAVVIFDTGLNRIKHNLQGVHERVRSSPCLLLKQFGRTLYVSRTCDEYSSPRCCQGNDCKIALQAVTCAKTHGSVFVTAGEDRKVILTDFDGTTVARVGAHGLPLEVAFSSSAMANTAALLSVAHSDGVSLASMQALLAGSAGKDAMARLELASKKASIVHHFWCDFCLLSLPTLKPTL